MSLLHRSVKMAAGSILLAAVPLALFGGAATMSPASKPDATTAACQACHGAHGEGMAAAHVPRIAGQSADYLKKQLDNYANGARDNPIMVNFAKPLSEIWFSQRRYSCARTSIGSSRRRKRTRAGMQQLSWARRHRCPVFSPVPGWTVRRVPCQCNQGVAGRDTQK